MKALSYSSSDDIGILSLLEISRETGIPMPTVLRLARENPDKIPSTGSGSQRYFSPEVIPVLEELRQSEVEAERQRQDHRALFLASRAVRRPASQRKTPRGAESKPKQVPRTSDENLARRLQALETRLNALGEEIQGTIDYLSQPRSATFRLL